VPRCTPFHCAVDPAGYALRHAPSTRGEDSQANQNAAREAPVTRLSGRGWLASQFRHIFAYNCQLSP
jgi:hypothetical protein